MFGTSIIGGWYSVDSDNFSLPMNDIVSSTQVQHYISLKNATVDTFLTLGDQLNEVMVNNRLINYLSNLYLNMTVSTSPPSLHS